MLFTCTMPVAIEGVIGSGKSSVLAAVSMTTGLSVTYEPVEKWTPFLENTYKSQKGQVALQARIMLDTCHECPCTDLVERNPALQPLTFIPALHLHQQSISHIERSMLTELHAALLTWRPDHTIFLTCSLPAAQARIRTRNRGCESSIDTNYLAILHGLYDIAMQSLPNASIVDTTDKPLDLVVGEVLSVLSSLGCRRAGSADDAQRAQPQERSSTM